MAAPGYAMLPVIPTFDKVGAEIQKNIVVPLEKASKNAGDAMSKGIGTGVDKASKDVEKAQYRVLKSTQELEVAESKLTEQKLKTEAANKAVETAARKREEAEGKGIDAIERAEQNLLKKRAQAEKASRDLASAEEGVEKAMTESSRATKSLEDRQKALEDAQKGAGKASNDLEDDLRGVGKALDDTAEKSGGFGGKIVEGFKTVGRGALLGIGAKAGTAFTDGVNQAMSGGFARLQSVEQAEKMLEGLGHSVGEVETIMDNAMASVKGTAFGFGEAASMAATFVGAGVQEGEELERVLALVGDTAAITGSDFNEMGAIWTKIASNQRLSTEELNQLMDRGLGLLPQLQEKYGVTADEARKMVTDGKVSFEDFSDAMENMVGGSAQSMGETFEGSAANARAALSRFGEKLLEPVFNAAPAVFGALGEAFDELGVVLEPVIEQVSEWLAPKLEAFATDVIPKLVDGFIDVANAVKDFTGWVIENKGWLGALAVAAGTVAGGLALMSFHQKVMIAGGFLKWISMTVKATQVWAGAQRVLNMVMKANPIGLVVTAIAGLVAGLAYFFTQTETGQKVWQGLVDGFKAAGEWFSDTFGPLLESIGNWWQEHVVDKFSGGWELLKEGVFGSFERASQSISDKWAEITTALSDLWQGTVDFFVGAWDGLKTLVFDAWIVYTDRVKQNWEIVTGALTGAWEGVKNFFISTWDAIRVFVFDAFIGASDNLSRVWGAITDAMANVFGWMRDRFADTWVAIDVVVFAPFKAGMAILRGDWDAATQLMEGAFSWMSERFNAIKDWIISVVFGGFKSGIDTFVGWVDTAVTAAGNLWDGLKRKFATPINFVIGTVYNDGIKRVFDGVAEKVGLDSRLPVINQIGGYAHGGILPGYTPGRDPYTFIEPRTGMSIGLSGGEAVLRPEATKALGRDWVDSVNAAARRGGRAAVESRLRHSHFANGGVIDLVGAGALTPITKSHKAFVARFFPGQFALTSALRFTDNGHHAHGQATDWQAQDGHFATQMPTPWSKALARAIYTNFGKSAELIHWPLDGWQNIKDGNPLNYGSPTNEQHANHIHWATRNAIKFDGDDIVLEDVPGAGGFRFDPAGWFQGLWDRSTDKLPKFDLAGFGDLAKVPGAALKTLGGWVKDWALGKLKEWADKFMNFMGFGGGGAEQWRDLASEALRRMGYGDEHLEAMLQQIQIESGGDPTAVNNWDINAINGTPSGGLLQVIEPTYRDVRNRYPDAFEGLPDDRFHPLTNLVAGVGAVKRDWGGPAGRWPTTGGYALGGVLPGFTPGRDVHKFFSPTGGSLALSGGEAIMVPEWTRAVGGPSAVAAMNAAARGSRVSTVSPGGFAMGGVWDRVAAPAGLPSDAELVKAMEDLEKQIRDLQVQLEKAANPHTMEGVMTRAVAAEIGEITNMLGGETIGEVISSLMGAETALLESRANHIGRLDAITEAEKELEEARKAAGEAAKAAEEGMSEDNLKKIEEAEKAVAEARESDDVEKLAQAEEKLAETRKKADEDTAKSAEKAAQNVSKANDDVVKAEEKLAAARLESAKALDIKVWEVAPQISGWFTDASHQVTGLAGQVAAMGGVGVQAAGALSGVAGALSNAAVLAGPAGISVGMAIDAVKIAIDTFKKVMGAIGDFVSRIFLARTAAHEAMVDALNYQHEWAKIVDDMRAKVVDLRVSWVEAQVALRDAVWKTRLAQADVVRAQLEGVKSVAEAEAALKAERERVARAAARDFNDLSLTYDRYRWAEWKGMVDRLDLATAVTPEILALEAEVNAAKLAALSNQRQASLSALEASWEQQKAALNLVKVQQDLKLATAQLALMTSELGLSQGQALQAMNTQKLYAERNQAQSEIGKNWWRLSYWATGAGSADINRKKELDRLIAEREASGAGAAGENIRGLGGMAFFGYGDSANRAVLNSGYGDAQRRQWEFEEQQALQQIELQKKQLKQDIEQSKLFEKYQAQVAELTAEIEALNAGESAARYTADYHREENEAVREATRALAEFEAGRSREYAAVARGDKQVVEITLPSQDVYTREQVEALVSAYEAVPRLEQRVEWLEAGPKPGAGSVLANAARMR